MFNYIDFQTVNLIKEIKKDPATLAKEQRDGNTSSKESETTDAENLFIDLLETKVPKYTSEPVEKSQLEKCESWNLQEI